MTQRDKQLLIKDLSARLPYSVWGLHRGEDLPLYVIDGSGAYMVLGYNAWFDLEIVPFKPYLRPMSSMTEEERKELSKILNYEFYVDDDFALVAEDDRHRIRFELCEDYIDWLVSHHFDYRGLIPMDLALEAKEGIYKTE